MAAIKSIPMLDLRGILDNRSSIDQVPPGSFRYKLNLAVSPDGKLGRALGFDRLMATGCDYHNHDYHLQATTEREPVTMLFSSVSNDGVRRLFAATRTRLMLLNQQTGDWATLENSFGEDASESQTQVRFHAAELANQVVFTNNFDLVRIHTLGTSTSAAIPTLAALGDDTNVLTKAKVVLSWSGFIFLMNTVEDGVRYPSRIRWCHLNDPSFWTVAVTAPDTSTSTADYQDLSYTSPILAAVALRGSMYVLTADAIWQCNLSVDTSTGTVGLNCQRIYHEPKNKAKCIAYPNSLTSDGNAMWYLGTDAVYRFSPGLDPQPERVEWIHRATAPIFRDAATKIDIRACESPVMEFRPATNDGDSAGLGELHLSWPTYQQVDSDDTAPVVCSPYIPKLPIEGKGLNNHTLVFNTKFETADYRDYGMTAYVNHRSDLFAVGDCNQQVLFIGASGEDFTLKTLDVGGQRVMYDPDEEEHYSVGYFSIARGIFPFEKFESEKEIHRFFAEITATNPNDASVAKLRLGTADRAVDPNAVNGNCGVLWHTLTDKPIKCSYTKTPEQYVAAKIRPNDPPCEWNYLLRGRFLMYELTIAAADGTAPTAGLCSISRFEVDARLIS